MDVQWKLRVSATFCRFTKYELFNTFVLLDVNPSIWQNSKLLFCNQIGYLVCNIFYVQGYSDHYNVFMTDLRKGVFTIVNVIQLASFSVINYVITSHLHHLLLSVIKQS